MKQNQNKKTTGTNHAIKLIAIILAMSLTMAFVAACPLADFFGDNPAISETEPAPAPVEDVTALSVTAEPDPVETPQPTPEAIPEPDPYPELKLGDGENSDVANLQRMLRYVHNGTKVIINGRFDEATEDAVKAFQAANGLEETGIVDLETWMMLMSDDAEPIPAPEIEVMSGGGNNNGSNSNSGSNSGTTAGNSGNNNSNAGNSGNNNSGGNSGNASDSGGNDNNSGGGNNPPAATPAPTPAPPPTPAPAMDYSTSAVTSRLNAFKSSYPSGTTGYSCGQFVYMMVEAVFGTNASGKSTSFGNLRPGDTIQQGNHIVVVLSVSGNTITVAEGGVGGNRIEWNNTYTMMNGVDYDSLDITEFNENAIFTTYYP